jgi:hypothetical protein
VELAAANYAAPFLDAAGAIRNLCIEKYKAKCIRICCVGYVYDVNKLR